MAENSIFFQFLLEHCRNRMMAENVALMCYIGGVFILIFIGYVLAVRRFKRKLRAARIQAAHRRKLQKKMMERRRREQEYLQRRTWSHEKFKKMAKEITLDIPEGCRVLPPYPYEEV